MSRSPNFRSLYAPVIETPNTTKLVAARAWVLTDIRSGEYLAGEDASARPRCGSGCGIQHLVSGTSRNPPQIAAKKPAFLRFFHITLPRLVA